MMLQVECARSASYYAACVAQEVLDPEGDPQVAAERSLAAALAKAQCSETYFHCASESIQLHGGVGFTWEYDPHLYFKRARASESFLGAPAWHRERIAVAILDEHMFPEERKAWERKLAEGGWTCVGWAPEHGGRGLSISQQVIFHEEYARAGGPGRMGHIGEGLAGPTIAARDPILRQRLAEAWSGLRIMRYNSLRMLSGSQDGSLCKEATIYKLFWSTWHASLGKLAMDVLVAEAELLEAAPYQLARLQSLYLFSRADTLYGGSNEIQRNIIAERALGMPKEPRLCT